jgi:hypothetical protein
MSDNGWPSEPGVPLNPERNGWHWVKPKASSKGGIQLFDESAPRPMPWNIVSPLSHEPAWNGVMEPKHADNAWQYLGPCLTPAEVNARVAQARRDALEEAAKWHEEQAKRWQNTYAKETLSGLGMQAARVMCLQHGGFHIDSAAAIRALGEKE